MQKDAEGDYALAAHFYCESLDYFLPAIQCTVIRVAGTDFHKPLLVETDPGKKEAIRAKVIICSSHCVLSHCTYRFSSILTGWIILEEL